MAINRTWDVSSTTSVPVIVGWKCSNCGTQNASKGDISFTYSSKTYSRSKLDSTKQNVHNVNDIQWKANTVSLIMYPFKKGSQIRTALRLTDKKCTLCHKKEIWMKNRLWLMKLFAIIGCLFFFPGLLTIFDSVKSKTGWQNLILGVAIWVLAALVERINNAQIHLDAQYEPKFYTYNETLKVLLVRAGYYPDSPENIAVTLDVLNKKTAGKSRKNGVEGCTESDEKISKEPFEIQKEAVNDSDVADKSPKSKKMLVIAGAILGVIAIAAGVYFGVHFWQPATCTQAEVCTLCGKLRGEPAPHTIEVDAGIAPTCETDGLTEGSHCSICNAIIKEQIVIPATGHEWKSSAGTLKCENCGETRREINSISASAVTDYGNTWAVFDLNVSVKKLLANSGYYLCVRYSTEEDFASDKSSRSTELMHDMMIDSMFTLKCEDLIPATKYYYTAVLFDENWKEIATEPVIRTFTTK